MMNNDQMAGTALTDESTQEAQPGQDEGTFFIPSDIIGDRKYKQGDTLRLQVMGTDQDGDLEVCFPGAGGGWQSDLRNELNNAKGA